MAMKPNYNYEKRQRELAKKKQQDEKRAKKLERSSEKSPGEAGANTPPATTKGD
ncbi:hypothetical protein [Dokdonella sp.]|uniref:hypothetical protein n=1 Tax=Dokdonella sp. TaxID=2291710 RepID=UPI002F41CC30